MNETTQHPARSMGFLSRLHDGELSAAASAEFLRHRKECPECAAAADEYEAVLALYRESGETPADPRLSKRILANLDARLARPKPGPFLRLNVDLVLASVVIVCLVGAIIAYSLVSPGPISIPKAARTLYVKLMGERPAPSGAANTPVAVATRETRARQSPGRAPENKPDDSRAAEAERAPIIVAETGVASGDLSAKKEGDTSLPAPARVPSLQAAPAAEEAAPRAGESLRDELEKPVAPARPAFVAPTLVQRVEPVIPSAARNLSLASSPVVLEAVIDESGSVSNVRVLRSNPLFDRAVIDAVRRWKYRPALLSGRPVAVKLTVTLKIDGR